MRIDFFESLNKSKLYFVLIIPFFQPLIFNSYTVFDTLFLILKIVSSLIIVSIYVTDLIHAKDIKKPVFLVFLLQIILFLSTLFNNGSISRYFSQCVPIVSVCMLTELWICNDKYTFLEYVSKLLGLFILINFLTVFFVNPILQINNTHLSMDSVFFLGEDNRFIFVMLPFIYYSFLYSEKYSRYRKIFYLMYILIFVTLLYRWSVAALVIVAALPLLYYMNQLALRVISVRLEYYVINILYLVLSLSFFLFKLQYSLLPFFNIVFQKMQTLESRFMLWDIALNHISNHPFIGEGVQSIQSLTSIFLVAHPHNTILTILFESGFLGLILIVFLFYLIEKKVSAVKNIKFKSASMAILISFLLLSIFDSLNHMYFYMLLISMFYFSMSKQGHIMKEKK
ncbi:O-antigen ligase family protein [Faecalicoccus acidiformans]|uniref:O-antigen ligase family protein n=1 Tax=Faecalicoccus acidiformans TaxID=915173 RepID=UPI0025A349E6|nr:O-antigen ligase family protein [Faecalicoccus acidiformans]MDM8203643.1 O-antigen ligase family protein [Faecalicoccus acidiformans]